MKADAIVVGSGAAGGWAAKELTERGMHVLLLEAGPSHGASSDLAQCPDEMHSGLDMGDSLPSLDSQPIQSNSYVYGPDTKHLFVDDLENPYSTPNGMPFVWIRGRQAGGRTVTWAGQSYRLSDHEFKAASKDGHGRNWPISHADLAPYYDLVEGVSNICGTREGIANLPDGSFVAPMSLSAGELHFRKSIASRWHDRRVIPSRRAMYKHPSTPWPGCNCVHKYWTSPSSTLAAALETRRLTLRTNSVVSHVIADESTGLATGVAYIDRLTKRTSEVSARVVVLCASTIETTRILLNSRSRRHPHGMANSTRLVGQNLMDHLVLSFDGIINYVADARPEDDEHEVSNGIYIPRFQNLTSTDQRQRFLRGFAIQAKTTAAVLAEPASGVLRERGKQGCHFSLQVFGEMLPRRENRVTLDTSIKDAWGIPAAHIQCSHSDNDFSIMSAAGETVRELAAAANINWLDATPRLCDPGVAAHEVGTAPMGDDPKNSVLNAFNQSWDVANLFVTDGACFASQGVQPPTLTIMALTARACAYIAEQWRRGHF